MERTMSFEEFAAESLALGYDEVIERDWKPNTVLDTHTHPFDARALVVRGEMWLRCGDDTRHLHAGDRFELEREVPHDERYGDVGATYWVGRRS